ncbi:putative nuclease HARBI1, partial [Spodoptera litura]|uniref:Nuclease HARBI1 n=1 Tax=Spodoptera litura TaxID=69820 RepID=A0A9J7EN93_SPOLT
LLHLKNKEYYVLSVTYLLQEVSVYLTTHVFTNTYLDFKNHAVSTEISQLLTLRYLATRSYLRSAADFYGVSPPTPSRIVKKVTESIAQLRPAMIKFPDDISRIVTEAYLAEEEAVAEVKRFASVDAKVNGGRGGGEICWENINKFMINRVTPGSPTLQDGFYQIERFPRVIGALDCIHVTIKSPGGDSAENYRNRKSNFSINVQLVCDSKLRCLDIVARWPGSVHDQTIFNNSFLKQRLESGQFRNSLILGDSGYELKQYLLTL